MRTKEVRAEDALALLFHFRETACTFALLQFFALLRTAPSSPERVGVAVTFFGRGASYAPKPGEACAHLALLLALLAGLATLAVMGGVISLA